MSKVRDSKALGILIITVIYIAASFLGAWLYFLLPFSFWLNLLIADVVATVFVFSFSVVLKNASVYDPYWSVQPIVILVCFAWHYKLTSAACLGNLLGHQAHRQLGVCFRRIKSSGLALYQA